MSLGHADRYFIFNVWNAALSSAASSLPSLVSTLSNIGANVDEALASCLSTKPSPLVSSLASGKERVGGRFDRRPGALWFAFRGRLRLWLRLRYCDAAHQGRATQCQY